MLFLHARLKQTIFSSFFVGANKYFHVRFNYHPLCNGIPFKLLTLFFLFAFFENLFSAQHLLWFLLIPVFAIFAINARFHWVMSLHLAMMLLCSCITLFGIHCTILWCVLTFFKTHKERENASINLAINDSKMLPSINCSPFIKISLSKCFRFNSKRCHVCIVARYLYVYAYSLWHRRSFYQL